MAAEGRDGGRGGRGLARGSRGGRRGGGRGSARGAHAPVDGGVAKRGRRGGRRGGGRGGRSGDSAAGGREARQLPPAPGQPTYKTSVSNWSALKSELESKGKLGRRRRPGADQAPAGAAAAPAEAAAARPSAVDAKLRAPLTKALALDCEMVGVGEGGERSALARVCIVNEAGDVVLDMYARPNERVTDWRTDVSGILPRHLRDAPPEEEVRRAVARVIRGRVLVGHDLANDLAALALTHPKAGTRDTATHEPFMGRRGQKLVKRSLRELAKEHLGMEIQEGAHDPADDARAALYLYMRHKASFGVPGEGAAADAAAPGWEDLASRGADLQE